MYTIDFLDHSHIPSIMQLIERVIKRHAEQGIEQWDEIYPDAACFARDIGNHTQRGLFYHPASGDSELVGIVSINEYQDPEYDEVEWELDDPCPLLVHRLSLDPAWQGKGLASLLMNYVEEYARENGYASIRLDAYTGNQASLDLYTRLGYRVRGTVRYRKGLFVCFEKSVAGQKNQQN